MCGIVGYIGARRRRAGAGGGPAEARVPGLRLGGHRRGGSVGPQGPQAGRAGGRPGGGPAQAAQGRRVGIGHTRWATHGEPTDVNAHPHWTPPGHVAVVHNGIVENAAELRAKLAAEGVEHGVRHRHRGHRPARRACGPRDLPLEEAVRAALSLVVGTYGLAVVDDRQPDRIVVARNGSPVVLGVGRRAHYVASDVSALVRHTDQIVHLDDHEMAVLDAGRLPHLHPRRPAHRQAARHHRGDGHRLRPGRPRALHAQGDPRAAGGPSADAARPARPALRHRPPGRAQLTAARPARRAPGEDPGLRLGVLRGAGGGAAHRGPGRIPADAETGVGVPLPQPGDRPETLYVAVSQSGETFDTLAAVQEVKRKAADVIGVVNAPGSTDRGGVRLGRLHPRRARGVGRLDQGFTSTAVAFALLALHLGRVRDLRPRRRRPADRRARGAAGPDRRGAGARGGMPPWPATRCADAPACSSWAAVAGTRWRWKARRS